MFFVNLPEGVDAAFVVVVHGVAFDELLASELSALSAEHAGDVTLDRPACVVLMSTSVQALAMALHELATNAAKHGALGQRNGHLHVLWRVEEEDGSPWILID
jgi:two-component system, chemotaxis family, CheB/CheR fusion protein